MYEPGATVFGTNRGRTPDVASLAIVRLAFVRLAGMSVAVTATASTKPARRVTATSRLS